MPKKVNEVPPFGSKYPWDEWFDGALRRFRHGEDFQCGVESFRYAAKAAAEKRDVEVSIKVRGSDVYIKRKTGK